MIRSVHQEAIAWRCQNRIVLKWLSLDLAIDFVALCHDDRFPSDEYTLNCETVDTYTAVNKKFRINTRLYSIKKVTYSNEIDWYRLLTLRILSSNFVDSFRNILENKVQINFIFLQNIYKSKYVLLVGVKQNLFDNDLLKYWDYNHSYLSKDNKFQQDTTSGLVLTADLCRRVWHHVDYG